MNREIKFRAWIESQSKMVYGDMLFINDVSDSGTASLQTTIHNLQQDCLLMQFTGLLDKNGKEIYEGDIICINPDDDSHIDFVIRDKNWLELKSYKNHCVTGCSVYEYHDQIEIIGNIYQNPELLK